MNKYKAFGFCCVFALAKEKETRQDEQSGLMKEAPHEVEEVTFDNRTSGVSEDDKLLQEISDILLLLKQRKKEE